MTPGGHFGCLTSQGKGKLDPEVYARRLDEAFGKSSAYEVEAVDPENWPELKTCLGILGRRKVGQKIGEVLVYIYINTYHFYNDRIMYMLYITNYICAYLLCGESGI